MARLTPLLALIVLLPAVVATHAPTTQDLVLDIHSPAEAPPGSTIYVAAQAWSTSGADQVEWSQLQVQGCDVIDDNLTETRWTAQLVITAPACSWTRTAYANQTAGPTPVDEYVAAGTILGIQIHDLGSADHGLFAKYLTPLALLALILVLLTKGVRVGYWYWIPAPFVAWMFLQTVIPGLADAVSPIITWMLLLVAVTISGILAPLRIRQRRNET